MGIIIATILGLVAGFILERLLTPNMSLGGSIHSMLNDYNEVDGALLILKQKVEDKSHYDDYVSKRIERDIKYLASCWRKTTAFIIYNPQMKLSINYKKLKRIKSNYSEYVFMCSKLKIGKSMILTIQEFLIMQENPLHCKEINTLRYIPDVYEIYDETEAKYCGNVQNLLEEEFRKEWY